MQSDEAIADAIEQRLRRIESELESLEPLKREHDRLERALQALREQETAQRQPSRPSRRPPADALQRQHKRARHGSNKTAILEFVTQQPGANAAQIADATGISRSVIYSALARLTSSEQLERVDDSAGSVGYRQRATVS